MHTLLTTHTQTLTKSQHNIIKTLEAQQPEKTIKPLIPNTMSASTHSKKKYTLINTTTISLGCSSGLCRRPKLSAFFHPRPRSNHHHLRRRNHFSSATSSSTNTTTTTAAFSESSNNTATTDYCYYSSSDNNNNNGNDDVKSLKAVQGFGRIGGASVAVEKDSDDPYLDFRQSMLQMILEREIYNKEDLKELLNCFLQLNSPYYHGIIVRAFTEIWNGVYSARNNAKYAYSNHASPDVHGMWMSRDY